MNRDGDIILLNNYNINRLNDDNLKNLNKEQLIFIHLLNLNNQKDDCIVSDLLTEQGIQNVLNCTLGFVSHCLRINEENGYIYRTKSKIVNCKRKQNVFFLTDDGLKLAREIYKMALNSKNKFEY